LGRLLRESVWGEAAFEAYCKDRASLVRANTQISQLRNRNHLEFHISSVYLTGQPLSKTIYRVTTIAMKLVIGGSTGFVGAELIRQGLENPAITSIVALGRRETPHPPEATKLRSVVCDNFESYSDSVKKELEDADACIWYGLPPSAIFTSFSTFSFHILCLSWFPRTPSLLISRGNGGSIGSA
jgi:hypothetical protein